jgi:transposase
MSLKPQPPAPVPAETARIAHAAFPKGSPLLALRDELGALFRDEDFAACYSAVGQPAYPPWRLALITILQFKENLSDRAAANAVRARIDWKYLLGLPLDDAGFDFSVLSEFRARLLAGGAEERLLHRLLDVCRERSFLRGRGCQRTDATHVLASVRALSRLELVAEALRAALNELATVAPEWTRAMAPEAWYKRYGPRIDEIRLPKPEPQRAEYAQAVGADGFFLLDMLDVPQTPEGLGSLERVRSLRRVWARHFERQDGVVRLLPSQELEQKGEAIESPYDPEARHRTQQGKKWTGYIAHLSETCDRDQLHLITHADTTTASAHEVHRLPVIHEALAALELLPREHLVDSAYVSADTIVASRRSHGVDLIGPARRNPSWQRRRTAAGAPEVYDSTQFEVDWEARQVRCPQGHLSSGWKEYPEAKGGPFIRVWFRPALCQACPAKAQCTRSKKHARQLALKPQAQHEALVAVRALQASEEGGALYALRSGIEGTISQGVRGFGLRRSRYRGLAKTHLQHVATAAAINLERLGAWLQGEPQARTRTSRFAALAA